MEVKSRPNTVLVMAVPQPVMCLRTRFDTARPQYSTVDEMRARRYDNTRVEQVGSDVDTVLLPIVVTVHQELVDCVPAPQRHYLGRCTATRCHWTGHIFPVQHC